MRQGSIDTTAANELFVSVRISMDDNNGQGSHHHERRLRLGLEMMTGETVDVVLMYWLSLSWDGGERVWCGGSEIDIVVANRGGDEERRIVSFDWLV